MKRIFNIGLPAMFEQLVMRTGMLIYVLTVTSLGTELYATHQIASSILTMSFMNGQAFGISASSLLGQSLGRKRIDHGKAYVNQCRKYALYISAILFVVFFFFGHALMTLFTEDQFIINEGAKLMKVVAFLQPFQTTQLVTSGALRGAGDTKYVAMFTFIGILIIRPLTSQFFIQVVGLGLIGAWLAMGIDQSFRSLFTFIRFNSGKWAKIKV